MDKLLIMKQTGWECPKCSRIYSPYIEECKNCTPLDSTSSLSHVFIRDDRNSGNVCRICGLQEWQHNPFTTITVLHNSIL